MRKLMIVLVAIFTFGLTDFNLNAQTVKFAHVDYLKVVDSIPSMTAADVQIKAFMEKGQKTIMDMEKAFEEAYNAYLVEKPTLSTIMIELREKDLMEQQQLIQYKQQSLEQDLQVLNQRLYGPIEESLEKAIEIVAVRHRITYMLEKSTTLYVDPNGGLDLTNEVRIELVRIEKERAGQ